ncbi:Gfo/Idh/MocA family oxidoreductase [Sandarakinorhabdus sp. AAP62]|uniref:Gfo/Idh/MocA family protein n=1 Tax=Sandarakinorhabdus sp. AAP62 TaxID=1248916 RepID=UPI00031B74C0|nr:Gfo/Idh/MocA family oxidoreductase [Sandarakinorhabdus sp. AAP62]
MSLAVGIIGAARVATYAMIAPARARDDVVVAAVAARDADRAAAYAATHGIPRSFGDYAAMVNDPGIDAIYVATPPAFHLEQARLAIRAGKPVLVEKPFTLNSEEAEILLAEAAAAGVPMVEAQHSRCHALWRVVQQALPAIGPIQQLEAWFDAAVKTDDDEFRWQASLGGGALMDLGVYPLTWVRAIAGEPLAVIAAQFRQQRAADAAFCAHLAMPGGVIAVVRADMAAPFGAELVITGRDGRIIVDNPLAPQRGGHAIRLEQAAGTSVLTSPADPGSYDVQLAAFVAHVTGGAPWPLPTDDPLRSMQAIDLVRNHFNQEKPDEAL